MAVSLIGNIDFYNPGSQLRTPTTFNGIAWTFTATGNPEFSGQFSFASTTGNSGRGRTAWISETLGGTALPGGGAGGTSSTVLRWANKDNDRPYQAVLVPGRLYYLNVKLTNDLGQVDTYRNIYTSGNPGEPVPAPPPDPPTELPQAPLPDGDTVVVIPPPEPTEPTDPPEVATYRKRSANPENLESLKFWVQGELDEIQTGFASTQEEMHRLWEDTQGAADGSGGSFIVPKGAKGDQGDPGPQGDKGDPGEPGEPGDAGDLIDDERIRKELTWSSDKINNELEGKAPSDHNLNSHPDVNTMSGLPVLKEGHVLTYDETTGTWRNQVITAEAWPTGLADGGELNIGPGVNDVEVIAGFGIITDSYTDPLSPPTFKALEWEQINEPITAAPAVAGSLVYLTLADTGVPANGLGVRNIPVTEAVLVQRASAPTEPERRDELTLGVLIHNGDTWGEVSSPTVINNSAHTLREFLNAVAGPTFIIDGGSVTEAALFTLDQAAGTIWEMNRNWHVDKKNPHREPLGATTGLQFRYVNRDFTSVGALTGTVDPTQWDDGGTVGAIPGGVNTATIQQLYQDPRDNYWLLWGQETFGTFNEAAASIVSPTVVPQILQSSVLLGYVVSEKGKTDWDPDEARFLQPQGAGGVGGGGVPVTNHDQLVGILPDQHHNQVHLLYGPDHSDVGTINPLETRHVLGWGGEWKPEYRNRFIKPYTEGPTYYDQEWVANDSYISVANKETTDFAFPTEVGDLTPIYPDAPPFLEDSTASLVRSGYSVTFSQAGEVRTLEVWVPEVSNDTNYTIVVIKDPNGTPVLSRTPLRNENLTANTWNLIGADSILHVTGSEVLIYLESQNYGATTQVTGGWSYDGQQNTAPPTSQAWNHNNSHTIVRVDKTDLDAVDRTSELMGIITGSTIQFAETAAPTNANIYTVIADPADLGTYIEYIVNLSSQTGSITVTANTTMTADVPVAQSTKFVYETDKFLVDPAFASIDSFLQYGDVDQPVSADIGYGINFDFQQLQQSPDWDLIKIGGGGGGGGGDFVPTTFTGAGTTGYVPDSVTEQGYFLKDDGTWAAGGGESLWEIDPERPTDTIRSKDAKGVRSTKGIFFAGDGTAEELAFVAAPGFTYFNAYDRALSQYRLMQYYASMHEFRVDTAGTTVAMVIDIGGNVGIGTDTPLDGGNYGTLTMGGAGGGQVVLQTNGVNNGAIWNTGDDFNIGSYSATGNVMFYAGQSERMRITSAGNVGIGTTTPANKLTTSVEGTTDGVTILSADAADQSGSFAVKHSGFSQFGMGAVTVGRDAAALTASMRFSTSSDWSTTAPTEKMRIDSAGNVGIGNTSPGDAPANAQALVIGDGTANAGMSILGHAGNAVISSIYFGDENSPNQGLIRYRHNFDYMEFWSGNSQTMVLDGASNVGVGVTTPRTRLHTDGDRANSQLTVSDAANGAYMNMLAYDNDNLSLNFGIHFEGSAWVSDTINSPFNIQKGDDTLSFQAWPGPNVIGDPIVGDLTKIMTLLSDGRVGIGTAGPAFPLHIKKVGAGTIARFERDAGGKVDLSGTNNLATVLLYPATGNASFISGRSNGVLSFHTDTDTIATNERMRITSAGNVGIGTASPETPLHVSGAAASSPQVVFSKGSDTNFRGSLKNSGTAGNTMQASLALDYTLNNYLDVAAVELWREGGASGAIVFRTASGTNGSERMRITSAGNVGIGRTPGAYNLDVQGDCRFRGSQSILIDAHIGTGTRNVVGQASGVLSIENSDERLKENIGYTDFGLQEILALTPRQWTWKDTKNQGSEVHYGFVAQEVHQVCPAFTWGSPDSDDMMALNDKAIIAALVRSVQELTARIEELENG